MLFPVWHINHYWCHLWGTHLIYTVVRHMDDVALMDDAGLKDEAGLMDEALAFSSFGRW